MSDHLKQNRDAAYARQAYARPTLPEFGPVGTLTQAGTGAMAEGNSNSRNQQRP